MRYSIFLMAVVAMVFQSPVWAEDTNPFAEGTQTVVLSDTEKASLLEYANNSKNHLEKALKDAEGLSFEQAKDVYLTVIKRVVVDSYTSKPRSELLMRYALNQALELTFGVPGTNKPGVIEGVANQDVLMRVLEDSIRLALNYYQDDRRAIESGKLMDLPYASLAQVRLQLAQQWRLAIFEWGYQYDFSLTVLKHWFATVANEEQSRKAIFAEEITDVDQWMQTELTNPPKDQRALEKRVRVLRKNLRELVARMNHKLDQVNMTVTPVAELNSSVMQFRTIPAGSFMMGSPENEKGRAMNELRHHVQLTNDFEMQTTTVTQKQYFDVMGVNPSRFNNVENCPKTFIEVKDTTLCPNNPVERVSWDDVQTFVEKLNANRKDGYSYRLPTEAEWEHAARAGTNTAYSFGNDSSQAALYGWFDENSGGQTHEVAQLKANGFGLYDMHGNVSQWVSDWYGDYSSEDQINPTGASSGLYRVNRGGSWVDPVEDTSSADRSVTLSESRHEISGFRLVRTRK